MTDDGWTFYGDVYDKQATLAVIRVLQADGKQVRVVKEGNRNVIWTREASK